MFDARAYNHEWSQRNKERKAARQREWREENHERLKKYDRDRHQKDKAERNAKQSARYHADPEAARRGRYKSFYGLTDAQYDAFKAATHCQMCGTKALLKLDHCHATGKIRGFLCGKCNTGLGKLGDTEAALLRALEYLRGR